MIKRGLMEPFLEQFREYLIASLAKLKAMPADVKNSAFYASKTETLEQLMIFVEQYRKKEKTGMKEIKIEFGDVLDINDLPRKESENSIKALIKKQAPTIPKGKMQIVKVSSGKWQTITNAVSALRVAGELNKDYKVSKRGELVYLIHE